MKRITVYCGSSSGFGEIFKKEAYGLGKYMAISNMELVYGGARVGLMGAVADGVLENGGNVIGILPQFLARKELQHKSLTETILVETMHERKAKMEELADGFIALPGGFGTMDELFEILTWAQLSLHNKPVALLNVNGYYDSLLEFVRTSVKFGFVKPEYDKLLIVSDNVEDLIEQMESYQPISNEKWFDVK